jgi:hypothetical protein
MKQALALLIPSCNGALVVCNRQTAAIAAQAGPESSMFVLDFDHFPPLSELQLGQQRAQKIPRA